MSVAGTVYALSLGDGPYRYIGITTASTKQRLYAHRRAALRGVNTKLYRWMRTIDLDQVTITALVQTNEVANLSALEKRVIADYSLECELLNSTAGGAGIPVLTRMVPCFVCALPPVVVDEIHECRKLNQEKFNYKLIHKWLMHEGWSVSYHSIRKHFISRHSPYQESRLPL